MEPPDRTNLAPIGFRVVVGAWGVALVVAAAFAIAAGAIRLSQLARANAIAANQRQFSELSSSLVSCFDKPRAALEQQLLKGRQLTGLSETENDRTDSGRNADEESIFSPAPIRRPTSGPAEVRVLRVEIDGSEISPDFAGWKVRLKFVNDYLRGATAAYPNRAALSRSIAGEYTTAKAIGYAIVIAGAVAMLCLILSGPVGIPYRRPVAAVGLAGAVLVIVLVSLHLARHRTPLLTESATVISWASVTLTLGLVASLSSRTADQRKKNCRSCGYDLTGNISGRCPECGEPTAQGQVDRWEAVAAAIAEVDDNVRQFTGTFANAPRWIELKLAVSTIESSQLRRVLAGSSIGCYVYNMSDSPTGRDAFEPPIEGEDSEPNVPEDIANVVCPACNAVITNYVSTEDNPTHCPACGTDLEAARAEADYQREQLLKAEVDRRERDQHLNDVRIKQVLTERRALFRTRSYFVVIGVGALVLAIQMGIFAYSRLVSQGFGFRVAAYLVSIPALIFVMRLCWRRINQYNAELAKPLLTAPAADPDFSTLSDGTQRLDTAAEHLEQLFKRD